MRSHTFIRDESETNTAQRGLYDQPFIVDNQRAAYSNRQTLFALLELPSVEPGIAVPEIDASVPQQIARRLRLAV